MFDYWYLRDMKSPQSRHLLQEPAEEILHLLGEVEVGRKGERLGEYPIEQLMRAGRRGSVSGRPGVETLWHRKKGGTCRGLDAGKGKSSVSILYTSTPTLHKSALAVWGY
jgi:hypothetical protein